MSAYRSFIRLMAGLAVVAGSLRAAAPAEAGWHSLTGVLPAHTSINRLVFSPDSRYVVFTADIEEDDRDELYSVDLTGGDLNKLNPPLVAGGDVRAIAVTPDSQYVIYAGEQEVNNRPDLYRVPIGGGEAARLNIAFAAGRNVLDFKIDPDNERVVYRAEQFVPDQFELFSVPIGGGQVARLNPTLVAGGDVFSFQIDRFLNRVVYTADQDVDDLPELYGTPIAAGPAEKLSPPGSYVSAFAMNPSVQVVVFIARPAGSNSLNLYMNATTGGFLTPLSYPLASNEHVSEFRLSPNGAHVVYKVVAGSPNDPFPYRGSLYSVLIGGGDSTPLVSAAPGSGVTTFDITADSERVVFGGQASADASLALESVPMAGGSRATLYVETASETLESLELSPDGKSIVYHTGPLELGYSVPAAGGPSVPLGPGIYPRFLGDGSRVLSYRPRPGGSYDLYSVTLAGSDARNLSRIRGQAQMAEAIVSPDGGWIVFWVDFPDETGELRVSDGGAAPALVYVPQVQK